MAEKVYFDPDLPEGEQLDSVFPSLEAAFEACRACYSGNHSYLSHELRKAYANLMLIFVRMVLLDLNGEIEMKWSWKALIGLTTAGIVPLYCFLSG